VPFLQIYCSRWRHLDLDIPFDDYRNEGLGSLVWDSLENLVLTEPSALSLFTSAPKIQTLTIPLIPIFDYPGSVSDITLTTILEFPLSQLTCLDLQLSFLPSQALVILQAAERLVEYHVWLEGNPEGGGGLSSEKIKHSHLQNLRINGMTMDISEMLVVMELPSLKAFSFNGSTAMYVDDQNQPIRDDFPIGVFSSFLARSRCALEKLTFVTIYVHNDGILDCLRQLPSLRELEMFKGDGDSWLTSPRLLNEMTWSSDTSMPRLLPNLEVLTVRTHVEAYDEAAFCEMVGSREQGCSEESIGTPLLRVRVGLSNN